LSNIVEFHTFKELLDFHDSNSRSFFEEAVKMVCELQSSNDNLKLLVKSWFNTKRIVSENTDQKDDCRIAILQENGSIFTEEIELEKIASLKAKLSLIASNLLPKIQWLQTVDYVMRYDLGRLIDQRIVAAGEVPESTFARLWNAGHAYLKFLVVISNLKKALGIIDNMDFSPAVFHSDLCGPKFIPKLLQFASEVLEKATEYAMNVVAEVKFSEKKIITVED